jgi:hypothetical protein
MCSSFVRDQPQPREATLNAIPPPPEAAEERTQRHLDMCRDLAEMAMDLARASAERAMQDWSEEEMPPDTQPKRPAARKPDPALTFVRLSGVVRQAITLEARIANGPPAQARRGREKKFDPRRATLKRLVHETTERNPDRNDLRKGAQHTIEDHLADGSFDDTPMPDLFQSICKEAGIEISQKTLSDEMLDIAFPRPLARTQAPHTRPQTLGRYSAESPPSAVNTAAAVGRKSEFLPRLEARSAPHRWTCRPARASNIWPCVRTRDSFAKTGAQQ